MNRETDRGNPVRFALTLSSSRGLRYDEKILGGELRKRCHGGFQRCGRVNARQHGDRSANHHIRHGPVLDNDIDYDATGLIQLTGAELDTTGTVGTIVWNSTPGEFTWSGPKSFFGTTEFRYKAADSDGLRSEWATVTYGRIIRAGRACRRRFRH